MAPFLLVVTPLLSSKGVCTSGQSTFRILRRLYDVAAQKQQVCMRRSSQCTKRRGTARHGWVVVHESSPPCQSLSHCLNATVALHESVVGVDLCRFDFVFWLYSFSLVCLSSHTIVLLPACSNFKKGPASSAAATAGRIFSSSPAVCSTVLSVSHTAAPWRKLPEWSLCHVFAEFFPGWNRLAVAADSTIACRHTIMSGHTE